MAGRVGQYDLVNHPLMPHFLQQGGVIVAAGHVHVAVPQHAAHTFGEQAGVPRPEPGSVGHPDEVELGLAEHTAHQVHITRGCVGVDVLGQRVFGTGLRQQTRVVLCAFDVFRTAIEDQTVRQLQQFVGAAGQRTAGAHPAWRKADHVVAIRHVLVQLTGRLSRVTECKKFAVPECQRQAITTRAARVHQNGAKATRRLLGTDFEQGHLQLAQRRICVVERRTHQRAFDTLAVAGDLIFTLTDQGRVAGLPIQLLLGERRHRVGWHRCRCTAAPATCGECAHHCGHKSQAAGA